MGRRTSNVQHPIPTSRDFADSASNIELRVAASERGKRITAEYTEYAENQSGRRPAALASLGGRPPKRWREIQTLQYKVMDPPSPGSGVARKVGDGSC